MQLSQDCIPKCTRHADLEMSTTGAGPGAQAARGTKEAYEIKLSALTLKRLDFSQSSTKCTSRYTVRAYMLKFNSLISRARFLSKFLPFMLAMSTRVSVCHLVRVSRFSRWVLVHHVADSAFLNKRPASPRLLANTVMHHKHSQAASLPHLP